MITLTDGTSIRVETGEFSLVTGNPQRIGDEALLRTAWHEVVRVMLLTDSIGRLWLVRVHRDVLPYRRPDQVARRRLSPHRKAQLVAKALRLKRELAETMHKLGRPAP